MDKKTEALKLALEALEDARTELCEWSSDVNREDYNNPRLNDAITAIREALAERQQEPVAIVEAVVPHLESIIVKHVLDAPFPKVGDFFYTSPPASKPWVSLTDEEIEKGRGQTFSINNPYCPCDSKTMRKAVRWAEAKLREKNNG